MDAKPEVVPAEQRLAPREDETRRRAKALGDPTRFAIFEEIRRSGAPMTIAELHEHFELNHTTIRQHLNLMVEAGLLDEGIEPPRGPGRPRLTYRVVPGVEGTWTHDGPYEQLAIMLVESRRSGRPLREVGAVHGRVTAVVRDGDDPMDSVEAGVARRGFSPTRADTGNVTELTLSCCPFENAAAADPATVCDLHRGLIEGLTEAVGGVQVLELVRRPPHQAGCRVRLKRLADRR